MEEIDIIELLKRVKEGNAPKEIEIKGTQYSLTGHGLIKYKYNDNGDFWFSNDNIYLDTKIKILDKPTLEELHKQYDVSKANDLRECVQDLGNKLNEIIRYLRSKDER